MRKYFQLGFASDLGNRRSNNQDSLLANQGVQGSSHVALLAVADGMGGYSHGEHASHTAVAMLQAWWDEKLPYLLEEDQFFSKVSVELEAVIERVHQTLLRDTERLQGKLGTTLSAIFIYNNQYVFRHVGDSRIYLHNQLGLQQLTTDQTWTSFAVMNGELTPAEAKNHRMRHVLISALGAVQKYTMQSGSGTLTSGDQIMLCTDGLYNGVSDQEIANCLTRHDQPQQAVNELMQLVKATEATDNISIVALKVGGNKEGWFTYWKSQD